MGRPATQSRAAGKQAAKADPTKRKTASGGVSKPQPRRGKAAVTKDGHHTSARDVVAKYGGPPVNGLVDDKWPRSEIVLADILYALLSSARVSHEIAIKALACLLDEHYQDLETLRQASWDRKTQVLTQGGYARYRERAANFFDELVELLEDKYGGDPAKILPDGQKGDAARKTLTARLQEIKGLGPVATDIFIGSIQNVVPTVAPFLDARSRKTAAQIGLGQDVDAMFADLGRDAKEMAKLEVALTQIRFAKKEAEFTGASSM
ncbi:hypothetical protein SPI_08798 [Niveomyces insectorum RCEF 264]|uniref:Uncharacterized protein n=1 Tax=Niveomyces insectorum RCEF 264 TaxID=1081102 RepID=A0A167MMX5_9HYPO|nr:hypothetical protein SPI_08798 [Niveomyces insectorum RCEF 264]